MFVGDYTGAPLGGPGNLLWDNALIEIFRDTAAEAASDVLVSNPSPLLDEGAGNGDFNGDGAVDGRDFLVWQRGGSPNPLSADDLALWQDTYGPEAPAAVAIIPEPGSLLLIMASMLYIGGATRLRG